MLSGMSQAAPRRVLYLGDGAVNGAAAYLMAIGHWSGFAMTHVPSDTPLSAELASQDWELVILSDYPAQALDQDISHALCERVQAGMGLWMIGGWASFHGQSGRWQESPLHELLPVYIAQRDDRVNCDTPAVACVDMPHSITKGLPFDVRPPSVGGYNMVRVRPQATQLLSVRRLGLHRDEQGEFAMSPMAKAPLLAVMSVASGRSIAWMTDVAPHWVGGWVDWGETRLTLRHPESREVEIGADYAKFVARILDWGSASRREG